MVERYKRLYGRRRDTLLNELLPIAEAYDRAEHATQLAEDDLHIIVQAAARERLLISMNAVELLQALSVRHPHSISRELERLAVHPAGHARFAALCATTRYVDPAVLRTVLKRGLQDRSARVRWKAADRAERLEQRDLLPDIERAVSVEKNAKTRREMEHHLRMLRDGYIAKSTADGRVTLWVRTPQGYTGHDFDESVIRERGIDAVVAELKQQ